MVNPVRDGHDIGRGADGSAAAGTPVEVGATIETQIDRLLDAAHRLAKTIAATEEITQRRAEILQRPQVVRGPLADGHERRAGIVSLSEAARRTGRHPEVLRRWCTEGRIPAIRIGRTWALASDTVAELMAHSARSRPRLSGTRSL
jgi:excisionase family DNA binding protein